MTALPGRAPIEFIEQHARIEAVPIEQVVVATDQYPGLDGDRQLDRLTRPQVADDILLLTEEIATVDRQQRQVNLLVLQRAEQLREEDRIAGVVQSHTIARDQKAHPARMPFLIYFISIAGDG